MEGGEGHRTSLTAGARERCCRRGKRRSKGAVNRAETPNSTGTENAAGTVGRHLRFPSVSFQHLSRANLVLVYPGLGNKRRQLLRRGMRCARGHRQPRGCREGPFPEPPRAGLASCCGSVNAAIASSPELKRSPRLPAPPDF